LHREKGDSVAVQQGAVRASTTQVAVRSAAAFGSIIVTMAIWWPAGIGVALIVCGVATLLANRMLHVPVEGGEAVDLELSALFPPAASDEVLPA
jgi:hypothetical protein